MSKIKRKLMLSFLERPKMVSKIILKSIKWKDGNLYENHQNTLIYILPADLLQRIRREMIATVGMDLAQNLLYHLNQLSADMIIRDAEDMDFKGHDKIRYFCAIMSIFGWGDCSNFTYDPDSKTGVIIMRDFPVIKQEYKVPIHYDFCGITARVIKLVYDDDVIVEETECAADGSDICRLIIKPPSLAESRAAANLDLENFADFDVKALKDVEEFIALRDKIRMTEPGVLMLDEDNRIVIKDVISINSMIKANFDNLGRKMVGGVLYRCARESEFPFATQCCEIDEIRAVLKNLSFLGWGQYNLEDVDDMFTVRVQNSPFTRGIPDGEFPVCYIIGGTLHQIFEKYLKTSKIMVKETSCICCGASECVFEIKTF